MSFPDVTRPALSLVDSYLSVLSLDVSLKWKREKEDAECTGTVKMDEVIYTLPRSLPYHSVTLYPV